MGSQPKPLYLPLESWNVSKIHGKLHWFTPWPSRKRLEAVKKEHPVNTRVQLVRTISETLKGNRRHASVYMHPADSAPL